MLCLCKWETDTARAKAVENVTACSWRTFPEEFHPIRENTQKDLQFAHDAFYSESARPTTSAADEGDQQGTVLPAHPSLPPRYWSKGPSTGSTRSNISASEETLVLRAISKVGKSDLHPSAPVRICAGDAVVRSARVFNEEETIQEERCEPSPGAATTRKRATEITDNRLRRGWFGGSPATAGRSPIAAKVRAMSLARQQWRGHNFEDHGVDYQL
eukprot:TRINITY_DN57564_c0_g1_i1.p1 TRINITY_DN57564_c0_g1~~TRINITY_DN57564_c0_g1_i1.p1  ORF type:complete len:215 (+),score=16.54 TRINITY_DN57564_c0_g1_i1:100-744(+)